MDFSGFNQFENTFQARYDNIKLSFEPVVVVTITLLRFKNVSVGKISDYFDIPDPEFRVKCPKIKEPHLNSFETRSIPDNTTKGEIHETFKFIVPKDVKLDEEFPIIIELYDLDIVSDDFIGTQTFDASTLPISGQTVYKSFVFGKKQGDLDVEMKREWRTSPDFRYSLGLCPEEKAFRKKRLPIVCEAMQHLLKDKGPKNVQETPVVSLIGSGGGYRAVLGMCGAMEALKDAGLLDIFTYACGLSGSAWYLTAAYSLRGMKSHEQKQFQEGLRKRFEHNLILDLVNPLNIAAYQKYISNTQDKYKQPHSFVNYFPGFLVGRHMLGDKMEVKLTDVIPYIEDGKVPYPIFIALHVKEKVKASVYHAFVERSPYEIYYPSYGIGLKPQNEGSNWNKGFLARECPEFPIRFTIGMVGCAFSILLNSFMNTGGELKESFRNFIDNERLQGKSKGSKESSDPELELESDDDDDDDEDENEEDDNGDHNPQSMEETDSASSNSNIDLRKNSAVALGVLSAFRTATATAAPAAPSTAAKSKWSFVLNKMKEQKFFTDRNAYIGRTARLYNFVYGMESLKRYFLNPIPADKCNFSEAKEVIENIGAEDLGKNISTKKPILSFADAGILHNVPTDPMLRPQRTPELLIVIDNTAYESDDYFNYEPLLSAAAHAWQSGMKFPNIKFEEITHMPPKEFHIFPSDGEGCPTVLWFTLCNKKFKDLPDYVPKSKEKSPSSEKRKFNDFPVFDEGNFCSTFTFQYSKYNFDQMRELMYFNVTSHIEEIKSALIDAIERKHKQMEKSVQK